MLVMVWFFDRGIDQADIPVVALAPFVVVLQYINRLAPNGNQPRVIDTKDRFPASHTFLNVGHMDIHIDLSVSHTALSVYGVRNNDNVLFGVVVPFVVDYTAYHGLYLALLEHLVNPY